MTDTAVNGRHRRRYASPSHPCPVCGGQDACSEGDDGLLFCRRCGGEQLGFVYLGVAKGDPQFSLYRREGDPELRQNQSGGRSRRDAKNGRPTSVDWNALARHFAAALTASRLAQLARILGLPEQAISLLPLVGYSSRGHHPDYYGQDCFTFPQMDASGQVTGLCCRYPDNSKKLMAGSRAGLYLTQGWEESTGPLLAVEGPTCALAGAALGMAVVGRPSNTGGVEPLAQLLRGLPAERPLIVLGEYDPNDKGGWPGLEGAKKTAAALADRLGRNTSWCLPPEKAKDVRAWAIAQGLDPQRPELWNEAGQRFLTWVEAHRHIVSGQAVIDPAEVATIEDLIRVGSEIRWLWDGWLQIAVLVVLAANAGIGKTRFVADLIRRIRHGLPWPDGRPMTLPPDARVLWVVSDNNHDELVSLCKAFGIVSNVFLNATKADPYGGTTLDLKEELEQLEARIHAVRPALVIIDTVGNATDKDLCRQEEAKAFFQPLQVIARRTAITFLCLAHLNMAGGVVGRRTLEKVRVAIRMDCPDEEGQPNRRRLEVLKSNSKKPAALGITMGDQGNEYDTNPPQKPDQPVGGRPPAKIQECVEWLSEYLDKTPKRVSKIISEGGQKGFSKGTIYRARDVLEAEEYEDAEDKKWWRLTSNNE
jgi:phage/plasmid primase-like uncharacterized protein